MNKDPETDEIPVSEFKEAIFQGTQEQKEILAMFCCADAHVQEVKKQKDVKGQLLKGIKKLARKVTQDRHVIEESKFE